MSCHHKLDRVEKTTCTREAPHAGGRFFHSRTAVYWCATCRHFEIRVTINGQSEKVYLDPDLLEPKVKRELMGVLFDYPATTVQTHP